MKKILPLIALVILIATACKKDKNEPDPTPNSTPTSNIPQWLQDIDGKKIEFTETWSRELKNYGSVELSGDNISDTIIDGNPFDSTGYINSSFPILSEIDVVNANVFELKSSDIYISGFYVLTNAVDNQDYYVFTRNDDVSSTSQVLSDTSLGKYYNPVQAENFAKGLQATIPNYDEAQYYSYSGIHTLLYIPKSTNLPILKSDLWQYAGSSGFEIDWNNPHPSDTANIYSINNVTLNKNIPFIFYENYTNYYAIVSYQFATFNSGGFK